MTSSQVQVITDCHEDAPGGVRYIQECVWSVALIVFDFEVQSTELLCSIQAGRSCVKGHSVRASAAGQMGEGRNKVVREQ